MPRFLRSRMVQDEVVAAAGSVMVHDLPVNPLSVILYTIRYGNSIQFTPATLANILATVARVEVVYKGQNIVSASLADLYAMAYYLLGRAPHQMRRSDSQVNSRAAITIPILLGRKPYDPKDCFPAVRRGELQLQTTPAAAFNNLGTVTLQVETIELLEAAPESFIKYTTQSKTPSATGDHDVDLPIGNPILGIMLFGTTVPVDGAETASINQLRLLLDNVEYGYALTNWENLKGHESLWCDWDAAGAEIQTRLAAGAPAGDALTEAGQFPAQTLRQYAFLPFWQWENPDYLLMTEGRARVHLRINADVADAIRVLAVEKIMVAQSATPGG